MLTIYGFALVAINNRFMKELSKMPASSKEIQQMPGKEATLPEEETKKDL